MHSAAKGRPAAHYDRVVELSSYLTPEVVSALVVALVGFLGVVVQSLRNRGQSWQETLRQEVEILKELPPGPSRDRMAQYVDHRIKDQIEAAMVRRRDPTGVVLALFFLGIGITMAIYAVRLGGWWYLLLVIAGAFILFGGVGLSQDLPKAERDVKGNVIPSQSSSSPSLDSRSDDLSRTAEDAAARPAAERGHARRGRAEPGP